MFAAVPGEPIITATANATVLIIEDSAEILTLMEAHLHLQYRILTARSGESGLNIANSHPKPDLILLDVMMPEMDGFAVLEKLRAMPATCDIPVIILSTMPTNGDVERGLMLGAADYITKPFTPGIVLARVSTQLESKQAKDLLKKQNSLLEAEVARRIFETIKVKNQLQAILDAIPDLLFEVGLDGRYYEFHSPRTELLVDPVVNFIGKTVSDILPRPAADVVMAALNEANETGLSNGRQFELSHPKGKLWFELSVSKMTGGNSDEPHFIVMSHDITERKTVKLQLRNLAAHLQAVREEEKLNIAREVHDELGGMLTALKMETFWLAEELSENKNIASLRKHVALMTQLTGDAVNVTRRIITGLRPAILDDLGLLAAIEWQAEQFQKNTGIKCRVNCIEDKANLDKQYLISMFRVFQESLTNVARHSGASKVEVEFHCNEDETILSVSDNGCGLPDNFKAAPTSFGMRGMCERVEQMGGKIKFDRSLSGGLSVTVTLLLQADNKNEGKL